MSISRQDEKGALPLFGYVLPVKCEMKIREYEAYRAMYCGVCKQLGKSYGVFSRFLLNYDLVLVAVLADAISGETGLMKQEGCFANPVAKHPIIHKTQGLHLASDALILLSYHKLCDNIQDEKPLKRTGYTLLKPFLKRSYKRAAAQHPELRDVLIKQMQKQYELEQKKCVSLDEASAPTAEMCAAIFSEATNEPSQKKTMHRLGLFAGQIVYLLDAAEDFEQDTLEQRYNPLVLAGMDYDTAISTVIQRCRMAAGEIALCYNLLEFKQYQQILENIFYLGLPSGIQHAGKKRTQRRTGHGQIESI